MHQCFQYPDAENIPQRVKSETSFVPKSLPYTARERKLITLQGSLGPRDAKDTLINIKTNNEHLEIEPPVYPLSKMESNGIQKEVTNSLSFHKSTATKNIMTMPCEKYLTLTSPLTAKDLKQFYHMRSSQHSPFHLAVEMNDKEHYPSKDGIAIQAHYNKYLSKLRGSQKTFSDIFGASLETREDGVVVEKKAPITAAPNLPASLVWDGLLPLGCSSSTQLHLRGPEKRPGSWFYHDQNHLENLHTKEDGTDVFTKQKTETDDNQKNVNIFGHPIALMTSLPEVRIAMFRIKNIPSHVTQDDLATAIRRCHCTPCKIWLPLNVLTGQHKGVGSIVVRESWTPSEDDNSITCSTTRFAELQKWFDTKGIQIHSQEITKEYHTKTIS